MTTGHDKEGAFLMQFTPVRDDILAYIYSMVPSHAEAEDIFQEVSMRLWQKFDEFLPGGNFRAWARKMVWNKVQNMRRVKKEAVWDPEVIEALEQAFQEEEETGSLADVKKALERCLSRLSDTNRLILRNRYGLDMTFEALGRLMHRSHRGLKVTAYRIRQKLGECVERAMLAEGGKP